MSGSSTQFLMVQQTAAPTQQPGQKAVVFGLRQKFQGAVVSAGAAMEWQRHGIRKDTVPF